MLELYYLKCVDSTHTHLKHHLKTHPYTKPICFYTQEQTKGIGSRDNNWVGKKGNLFFSFALHKSELPKDLPLQSASIYFSYVLKNQLEKLDSKIWLKWPNDFYIMDHKIGGTITTVQKDLILCGIGLNLLAPSKEFQGNLDIDIVPQAMLENYFNALQKSDSWKQIFSLYEVEFHKNKKCKTTIDGYKTSLKDAVLHDDGSITIDNKRVYSLR
ncbi:MAG: biotin--[acetyl-CoA-carboxylase] ligase [Campylobacterota bacterium]|nr:biotin--[acetyl-CoA-carboxylase] ligase [Campylobacterota bacterium]